MNHQQLFKKSKLYSRCKKRDIEKTLGVWVGTTTPFVARWLMLKPCDFNEDLGKFSRTPDISFGDLSCLGLLTFGNIAVTDEF